jgi:hypothetical protein
VLVVWILALCAIVFALADAVRRYRATCRLLRGGFEAELEEIAGADDPALLQALRNELTVSVEAALARIGGGVKAHLGVGLGAGGLLVVSSAQARPMLSVAFAVIAAAAFVATLSLGNASADVARKTRKRWRDTLGMPTRRGGTARVP